MTAPADTEWPFEPPRTPMEAVTRDTLPEPPGWAYEPKWDGFRTLAWSPSASPGAPSGPPGASSASPEAPRLDSRNSKPLLRYFPELGPALDRLPPGTVVDGEIVVVQDGRLDFDALQNRIHPAQSRVRRLAVETPATVIAFDLLAVAGADLRSVAFRDRRLLLIELFDAVDPPWQLTPSTEDLATAERWFHEFEAAGCDGIVAKRLELPYQEGVRAMAKVKHRRTVDTVVGGYRLQAPGDRVGSLLLGLYDATGRLHFVGHCSSFGEKEARDLLPRLQALRSSTSFGEGARQPGGESRWTGGKDLSWEPVRPELVAEVSYDQITGGRFRHATRLERWRVDKDPRDCTMDQLDRPSGLDIADVFAAGDTPT